jgi:hypothetical protein
MRVGIRPGQAWAFEGLRLGVVVGAVGVMLVLAAGVVTAVAAPTEVLGRRANQAEVLGVAATLAGLVVTAASGLVRRRGAPARGRRVRAGPAGRASSSAVIAGARRGRLCELPPSVGDFTGRHEELARLRVLAAEVVEEPSAAVVTVISGQAGIGKTALALHLAHGLAGSRTDVSMWTCRGCPPSRWTRVRCWDGSWPSWVCRKD